MPAPNPTPELDRVADLLRQTFDPPDAAPLDPAVIRLMLELAHASDEQPRPLAASLRRAAPPPRWPLVIGIRPLLAPRRRLGAN